MIKLSFVGDIMCEEPFLKAAETADGTYEFDNAFAAMKKICANSDYVIGNLETPLAGEDRGYTHEMYSFNTPDCFAKAIKKMGISFVLTANNHCCDRGIDGLKRTLQILDQSGLRHTGTFDGKKQNMPALIEIGEMKIAVISCTSSTNASRSKCKADMNHVNLLQEQHVKLPVKGKKDFVNMIKGFLVEKVIGEENRIHLRKLRGLPPKKASMDNMLDKEAVKPYIENICSQIKEAKKMADLVFVCPHIGGQFNTMPGRFSEYVMDCLAKAGADAVVASHPHIVQKAELKGQVPCVFSLGNVSMSMSTLYVLRDELPDYGIMLHFYLEKKKIQKVTYSLIKMEEDTNGYLYVCPVFDLYKQANEKKREVILQDVQRVMRRFTGNIHLEPDVIKEEFELYTL